MSDFVHSLQNVPAPFNMVVLLAVIGGIVAVLCTAIVQVRLFAGHRANLQLKRELVERGLSAERLSGSSRRLHPVDGKADAFPAPRRKTIFSAGPSEQID